jgi:peptidoglycan/xylan/chitin deacetylase (PgdA/CDA1 family)
MTAAEVEADLESGLPAIVDSVRLWRTPWGIVTPATEDVARKRRLTLIGWTADTEDWRGSPPDGMLARVARDLRDNAIVLMHDGVGPGATRNGCAGTVDVVSPLVSLARSRGLEPRRLCELRRPLPDRNPDSLVSSAGLERPHLV